MALRAKRADMKENKTFQKYLDTLDPNFVATINQLPKRFRGCPPITKSNIEFIDQQAKRLGISSTELVQKVIDTDHTDAPTAFRDVFNNTKPIRKARDDLETIDLGNGYKYQIEPQGSGYVARFVAPKDLLDNEIQIFKVSLDDLKRHARQVKESHQKSSKYINRRWNSKHGMVTRIEYDSPPRLDEPDTELYRISFADGQNFATTAKEFQATQERHIREATPEYQAQRKAEIEERERINNLMRQRREALEKQTNELMATLNEWLDISGFNKLTKGRITKTLLEKVNYSGTVEGVMTRGEFCRKAINEANLQTFSREVNKYKDVNRRRWNNMTNDEQDEFNRKYNSGQTKTEYFIGNENASYKVSKFEYEYAKYLENKKAF